MQEPSGSISTGCRSAIQRATTGLYQTVAALGAYAPEAGMPSRRYRSSSTSSRGSKVSSRSRALLVVATRNTRVPPAVRHQHT